VAGFLVFDLTAIVITVFWSVIRKYLFKK